MKKSISLLLLLTAVTIMHAQNTGIGTKTPIDKLNVDSGNIRIGKDQWLSAANSKFLKIGDADYITLGEEEADDKLTIRAKELLIRPSSNFTSVPVTIQGSSQNSLFYFDVNEDTYLRGGKSSSNVIIGSDLGGRVGISVYPQRAGLEQNGAVGATAALFGGDGTGISLQKNWPAIGFNSYLDGAGHKAIAQGYGAQMGLNQINGSLYLVSFPFNNNANTTFPSYTQRFYISRFGKIGIGTDDPYADIEIIQRDMNSTDEDVNAGITYRTALGYHFNTHIGYGVWHDLNGNPFADELNYSFWSNSSFQPAGQWYSVASISQVSGEYWTASDEKLKTNITAVNNGMLSKIRQLKPAVYHMKNEAPNCRPHLGFIAQELQAQFPELVMDTKTNKQVYYSGLIPVLTKGIQEQQQQIEELKMNSEEMKKELQELKSLILSKNKL